MPPLPPRPIRKLCTRCLVKRPVSDFYRAPTQRGGRTSYCRFCLVGAMNEWRRRDPRNRLIQSSKSNAKANGIEHTLTKRDIPLPEFCVYLGIKLNYELAPKGKGVRLPDSPSLDRIDPNLGYIPGNVQVISDLANRMKTNATVEQLIAFAKNVLKIHGAG